jgi:hypothetical protein
MVISGCIQNGVVVLPNGVALPEGAVVTILYEHSNEAPLNKQTPNGSPFPLVRSACPGSIDLTNDRVAELLDEPTLSP